VTLTKPPADEFKIAVKRARLDEVVVYEVTESELVVLERGGSDSLLLNIAIFLFSSALTLVVAMLTTNMGSPVRELSVLFVIAATAIGMFLAGLWYRGRLSASACSRTIRNRLPPNGVLETIATADQSASTHRTTVNSSKLLITSARYGAATSWVDVTAELMAKSTGQGLVVPVSNEEFGGDPCPNVAKTVEVTYQHQGLLQSVSAAEGSMLRLP